MDAYISRVLRADDARTRETADNLYNLLQKKGTEVIYDDREGVRPGEMFADADLLGVPVRVIVSPRNLKENKVEIVTRDKTVKALVATEDAGEYIAELLKQLSDKL